VRAGLIHFSESFFSWLWALAFPANNISIVTAIKKVTLFCAASLHRQLIIK
jgi:hypothetical protein